MHAVLKPSPRPARGFWMFVLSVLICTIAGKYMMNQAANPEQITYARLAGMSDDAKAAVAQFLGVSLVVFAILFTFAALILGGVLPTLYGRRTRRGVRIGTMVGFLTRRTVLVPPGGTLRVSYQLLPYIDHQFVPVPTRWFLKGPHAGGSFRLNVTPLTADLDLLRDSLKRLGGVTVDVDETPGYATTWRRP